MTQEASKPAPVAAFVLWRTTPYMDNEIERVECTRRTDSSVWVLERPWSRMGNAAPVERRRSLSSGDTYHETWRAAADHLIGRAEARIQMRREEIARTERMLEGLRSMQPPEGS